MVGAGGWPLVVPGTRCPDAGCGAALSTHDSPEATTQMSRSERANGERGDIYAPKARGFRWEPGREDRHDDLGHIDYRMCLLKGLVGRVTAQ